MPKPKTAKTDRKPAVFGWCMTNQHQDCRVKYELEGVTRICPCECHKAAK